MPQSFFIISTSCLADDDCFSPTLSLRTFHKFYIESKSGLFPGHAKLPLSGFLKIKLNFLPVACGTIMHNTLECLHEFSAYFLVVPGTFCRLWLYQGAKSTNQKIHCMAWLSKSFNLKQFYSQQSCSSSPLLQSRYPLHCQTNSMHWPLLHRNHPSGQVFDAK